MKKWKNVWVAAVAFVMAAGLCACGGGKGVSSDPALGKQYVYRLQEFDLGSLQGPDDDTYVQSCMEMNGRVYLITQSYNYQTGSEYTRKLLSMNRDGSDMKVYDLASSMEGQESTKKRPDTDEEAAEGTYYEYTGFSYFQLAEDGYIYGLKNYNYDDYSDPENYVSIRKNYVCAWDLEGRMLWETPIEDLQTEDSWSYVECLMGLPEGKVALLISGDKMGTMTVDSRGNVSQIKPMSDELSSAMERRSGWTITKSGLLLTYYDENWQNLFAVTYDMETGQVGDAMKLPSSMLYNGTGGMTINDAGDLIYTTTQGVFKYRVGDEEPVQLMSYINSDMEINRLDSIVPIDDEHFIGIYSEYDDETYHNVVKGGTFVKVDPADIPDKQVMVLAGNNIPYDLRRRAIAFNKSSSTHRIVLKEYSQFANYDDYYAGITQLNNDIISGNMPDILVVEGYGSMTVDSYISKKLLADIGKLIKEDEELSKEEFMENVFDACRVNGKLYEIIPTFQVISYAGKMSLIGEREDGWTLEEAQAVLSSMPAEAKLFSDMSQTGFISVVMEQCGSDYVDVATGKCNFNTPEFISLLEFAKTLPTEEMLYGDRDDSNWEAWYKDYETQYRENRTLLANCYIGSIQNMVNLINGQFGEDVSFAGFPGSKGRGGVIRTGDTFALSARSANLDAAWEFMRYYLTDEYQDTLDWQLPILKKKFDENAKKGTQKPWYEDENGEKIEYEYTYWINDDEIVLDPLTQEQVDRIVDYVTSVKRRVYSNTDVMNIITEEIDAFFKGDKSAEDVAGIIQSRVQVYVNENR